MSSHKVQTASNTHINQAIKPQELFTQTTRKAKGQRQQKCFHYKTKIIKLPKINMNLINSLLNIDKKLNHESVE